VFVALRIQHAMDMRHVACPALQYFPKLSQDRQDFGGGKVLEHKKICLWFPLQVLPVPFLILRITERDMIKNKYTSILSDFNFLDKFAKNTQKSNLIKFRPVGAELFHADGRTDRQT